jgi:hypothetical protein
MAQGLLTATAGTGSGFILVNLFILIVLLAINELDCEHVRSQLTAHGFLTATVGTCSGNIIVKFYFFNSILRYQ